MTQLLLIDDDLPIVTGFGAVLRSAGYNVATAASGQQGLMFLERSMVDLVVSELRLPDMSGLDVLQDIHRRRKPTSFVVVTGVGSTRDAVTAMRLGAADFLEKPVFEDDLLQAVETALTPRHDAEHGRGSQRGHGEEAHAAARWARALVPVIDAPRDPRTITGWSRLAYASPGALRNWCRMTGMSPRRSLVFARLLRAVVLGTGGKHKPEDLLDVVDRRTLVGLLKLAGLNPKGELPNDIDTFLQRQTLVSHPDALCELNRAIAARSGHTRQLAKR